MESNKDHLIEGLVKKWEDYIARHGHPLLNEVSELVRLFPGSSIPEIARWLQMSMEDARVFLYTLMEKGVVSFEQTWGEEARMGDIFTQEWHSI